MNRELQMPMPTSTSRYAPNVTSTHVPAAPAIPCAILSTPTLVVVSPAKASFAPSLPDVVDNQENEIHDERCDETEQVDCTQSSDHALGYFIHCCKNYCKTIIKSASDRGDRDYYEANGDREIVRGQKSAWRNHSTAVSTNQTIQMVKTTSDAA